MTGLGAATVAKRWMGWTWQGGHREVTWILGERSLKQLVEPLNLKYLRDGWLPHRASRRRVLILGKLVAFYGPGPGIVRLFSADGPC